MRRALDRAADLGFDHFYLDRSWSSSSSRTTRAPRSSTSGGYFDLTTLDVASDFRRDVGVHPARARHPVEYTHHEVGPSQHDIDCASPTG